MSPAAIGGIAMLLLFVLMFMGVPIGFSMFFVALLGFGCIGGFDAALNMIAGSSYSHVASYTFAVLPLFMLMGEFADTSGLVRDAYNSMYAWLGRLPGGLAMASVGGCAAFAAVCGSSAATAAAMTRICLPEMLEYRYDPKLAAGCIAAGSTMGILIPPSMGFILYGMIAEESVGRLFMAGVIPGILEAVFYIITIYILCKLNPMLGPAGAGTSWRQKLVAVKGVWGILILFLLVMGGIYGGIFTPTEAAAVGALGALLFVLGRKRLTRQNLIASAVGTIRTTGMVMLMLIGAIVFGYFLTITRLPTELANWVVALPLPPMAILACILLVFIILGCFVSVLALMLILVPIFLPVLSAFGFDLVWFGVLMVRVSEIGMITPPIGGTVFLISGMVKDRGISMYAIFRGIIPFVIADICHVALLVTIPQLSLFLPQTMLPMK